MVYQVSESAVFSRKISPLPDQRAQKRCEEIFGHVLKVNGSNILCTECGAEWKDSPDG